MAADYSLSPVNPSKNGEHRVRYHPVQSQPGGYDSAFSGSRQETTKTPLEYGIKLGKYFIHVLALAATGTVFGLNFSNCYGWDLDHSQQPSTAKLNALQFAAKLHEILIVGSLSSMVMFYVRNRLVTSKGIPFGLLSSGYQVSSAEYLFSKSLLSTLLSADWLLVLPICLLIVYANMVGPSSASAMIPNLDWWPVASPFDDQPLTMYFEGPRDMVYPTSLGPPNMTRYEGCDTVEYDFDCPCAGYENLVNWALAWQLEGIDTNVSMTEIASTTRRTLSTEDNLDTKSWQSKDKGFIKSGGISFTSTIPQSFLQLQGLFYNYVHDKKIGIIDRTTRPQLVLQSETPLYAPVVQVQCSQFDYTDARNSSNPASPKITLPLDLLDTSLGSGREQYKDWPVDASFWDFTRPMNTTNFTWMDVSHYTDSKGVKASLAGLVTVPYALLEGGNDTQRSLIVPCTISARWAAAEIQFDPFTSTQISHNLSQPSQFQLNHHGKSAEQQQRNWGLSQIISIAPEWASLLNVKGINGLSLEGKINASMVEHMLRFFVFNASSNIFNVPDDTFLESFSPQLWNTDSEVEYGDKITYTIRTILGMVVAEGLARQNYDLDNTLLMLNDNPANTTIKEISYQKGVRDGGGVFETNISRSEVEKKLVLSKNVPIRFDVNRYGYGYGYQGKPTVQFGLAVLAIHVGLVLIFVASTIYLRLRGRLYMSSAWSSMGELLAIAMVSREPSELRNTGAGVKRGLTWRKNVRIREKGADDLEFVVGNRMPGEEWPKCEKKYG